MRVMDAKPARPWDTPGVRARLTRSSLAVLLLVAYLTVGTAHASSTIGADGFLSPDHKTWCSGNAGEVGCVAFRGSVANGKGHGAIVKRGGKIVLCPESSAGPSWACFQNFDETAPVLHYGESTEVGGFRCKSTKQGVTCLVRNSGRGFRIDRTTVTAIRG
jgi:hypothetical protein